ncbi:MAG TPA: hypothetical protein VMZ28_20465 [Kofleriaceae bacterium]|nr:hypothetical protein [Kofleriaceae bacterium]
MSATGCIGDLVPLNEPARTDGGSADLTTAAKPDGGGGGGGGGDGGGGGTPRFIPGIQNDLDAKGCSSSGCHGGTQVPVVRPMPTGAVQQANYDQVLPRANTGASSLLLTKGLPGQPHLGGVYFPAGVDDAMYKKWLSWITAGSPSGL